MSKQRSSEEAGGEEQGQLLGKKGFHKKGRARAGLSGVGAATLTQQDRDTEQTGANQRIRGRLRHRGESGQGGGPEEQGILHRGVVDQQFPEWRVHVVEAGERLERTEEARREVIGIGADQGRRAVVEGQRAVEGIAEIAVVERPGIHQMDLAEYTGSGTQFSQREADFRKERRVVVQIGDLGKGDRERRAEKDRIRSNEGGGKVEENGQRASVDPVRNIIGVGQGRN